MFASRKLTIAVAAGLIALGSASVYAMKSPEARQKLVRQAVQKAVTKAGIDGERADKILKVVDGALQQTAQQRKELREAMSALAATQKSDKQGPELKRAIDRVQAAFVAMVDNHGKTISQLREVLSPAEQAKLISTRKGLKILALPGMRKALPALIGHARGEALASVDGLDPAASKKLDEIGEKATEERAKIVEKSLELVKKLRDQGPDSKESAALVDQIVNNGNELRETVTEQIAEVRKNVPDAELAKVLVSMHQNAKTMREKMRALREAAADE